MLIDEAEIVVSGGHGGAGIVSFGNKRHAGPDGGNGGRGGDFFVRVTPDITLLSQFSQKKEFSAGDGKMGDKQKKTGKDGEDFELLLPVGTTLTDLDTNEVFMLEKQNERIILCEGGLGGRGNFEFRSARRTTPMFAQRGLPGQKRRLHINLKLIADFGLLGLPNAGKSSLLNELTSAKAKVGAWAFTTLEPNLGVIAGKVIADIPGLIEGAHEGKGLGIKFLKHIEKVGLLIHCISASSKDPEKDYKVVRNELSSYNKALLKKPEIIVLTKSDLLESKELSRVKRALQKINKKVYIVSIYDWDSINALSSSLIK